jgi:uncharacterized SAM-binding protein YcdF (DUF218 family)
VGRRSRWVLIALGITGVAYGVSLAAVWRAAREDQRRPAGAIVVLGAAQYNGKPSPVLKARLEHALILHGEGLAPLIVVTGGIGSGDRESEATVGRRFLIEMGIPDSLVVVLPEGKDTHETMTAVAEWVNGRQLIEVILVSDAFHLARLRADARRHGLTAWTSPSTSSPITGAREWGFLLQEGWKLPASYLVR